MYINFYPGSVNEQSAFYVNDNPAYGMAADLGDFFDSVRRGISSSISVDGTKDALEDGEVLGSIVADYSIEELWVQMFAEELHYFLEIQ